MSATKRKSVTSYENRDEAFEGLKAEWGVKRFIRALSGITGIIALSGVSLPMNTLRSLPKDQQDVYAAILYFPTERSK